jgi:hypothetical protein
LSSFEVLWLPRFTAPVVRSAALHEDERLREIATAAKGYREYDEDRVREWIRLS